MDINLMTFAYKRHKHPSEIGDDPSTASGKLVFEFDDRCWSEGRTAPGVRRPVIRRVIAFPYMHMCMLHIGRRIPISTGSGVDSRDSPAFEKDGATSEP